MEDDVIDDTLVQVSEPAEKVEHPLIPKLPAPFDSEAYEIMAFHVCHDPKDLDMDGESNILKWAMITSAHNEKISLLYPFAYNEDTIQKTPLGLRYGAALTHLRCRFFERCIEEDIGSAIVNHAMYVHNLTLHARLKNKLYLHEVVHERLRGN